MKKKVLFVGSFKDKARDGSVGGQMYASRSLIQSDLKEHIDWILLDTTGESVPPPPLYIRLLHAVKRMMQFLKLLIFKKPDSILIFSANGPSIYEKGTMVIVASLFRTKVILAPRGGPLDKEIEKSPRKKKFLRYVFSKADHIVCQGAYWETFFSSLVDVDIHPKFVIIPNWIDIDRYNLTEITTAKNDAINILYMGWIQEDKGVYDIFKAIAMMGGSTRKINFYFLGDGPARQTLKQMADSGKYFFNFFFPGWIHGRDKLEYISNSDIFVLASHSEGLPNSLMEAMGCGVASIATNVGSVSDLIINEETGILVEKGAIADLANGLTRLIESRELRTKLSINGKKWIIENNSIFNAVNKFKKIL